MAGAGDGGQRDTVLHERVATLEPDLQAPRTARTLLRSFMEEVGRSDWVESAELAISEVVTNATLHAHTAIQLSLEAYQDRVCVEVRDFNPTPPVHHDYDREATTGRGMALVAAVTVECGVRGLPDGKVVWFCVGDDERSDEDLLAAWEVEWGDELPAGIPTCDVVLVSLPATLWLAAGQHQDAILRELVLYRAAHDGVDIVAADEARSIISVAAAAAVEAAQAEGTARPALPEGHPSPLPWVPGHLDLRIRVAADGAGIFAALQDTLDAAERLAAEGKFLIRPALPEIVAVRDWACEQIIAQLGGTDPSPWPGTAQERFEVDASDQVAALDGWDRSAVVESEQGVVAADDSNRIVAVSRPFADLVGWDPDALVGRRVVTLIPPALREAHVAGFTRHLTTGEAHALGVPLSLPVLHRGGREINCSFLVEQVATSPRSIYVAWIEPTPGLTSMTDRQFIPENELERIAAVRRFEILDTPPDGVFDRIAAVAARTFGVPIGIVSVVDTDRIWFKARHGLPDVSEIGREPGLCASAIVYNDPWVVTDASSDPRTLANPLVAGDFGLRFYAGVPLTTAEGYNLGTLCVLDTKPRAVTDTEMATLADLAAIVVDELEVRRGAREITADESALRREAEKIADALQASLLPPRPPTLPAMELATRYLPGTDHIQVGGDFFDVWRRADNDWRIVIGDACGKGAKAASLAALVRWSARAASVHQKEPAAVLADLNDVLRSEGDRDDHFCTVAFARLELDTCGAWVTVALGGHPQPLLVRASGKVELRGVPSVPIGLFDAIDAVDDRVGLGAGDALIIYTDGITEARDEHGEQLGEGGLFDVLGPLAGASAEELASAIVAAARAWSDARLVDDAAVLVLRVPDTMDGDRLAAAIGISPDELRLPGYPHDCGPPT